jgi:2-polyprenyl-6-methoxyphenol hydroxylase-like FAD-dependent oxidoreductase
MSIRIVVAGGGIGGLSFAAAARRVGFVVTVVERAPDVCRANIGSGIGLWPNSLACLDLLGAKSDLEKLGSYMPRPSYRDKLGRPLALAPPSFPSTFPVLCLHRDRLQRVLFEKYVINFACRVR